VFGVVTLIGHFATAVRGANQRRRLRIANDKATHILVSTYTVFNHRNTDVGVNVVIYRYIASGQATI